MYLLSPYPPTQNPPKTTPRAQNHPRPLGGGGVGDGGGDGTVEGAGDGGLVEVMEAAMAMVNFW